MSNLIDPDIPNLKIKHGAKAIMTKAVIKEKLTEKLKEIPELSKLKLDEEITRWVCELVEDMVHNNKKKKIDKKLLVVSILADGMGLNTDEREAVSKHIDFLYNNKMIKKKLIKKYVGKGLRLLGGILNVM